MVRLLITGGSGQVGTELKRIEWPGGVSIETPTRRELDLADPDSVRRWLTGRDIAAVINAGAYTAVDQAETEIAAAFAVNAFGPAVLAEATRAVNIPLIHVSTDYVFDGTAAGEYREDDPVRPVNVYGASKEAGEQAVRSGNPRHVIVRTAWVFSAHGSNFVKTMLRLGADREVLSVVNDQHGCPTSAADIAHALATIAHRLIDDPGATTGTFHFVNAGQTSWFGLAEEIFRIRAENGHRVPRLEPIPGSAYPTPAKRPANSVLATEKIAAAYGLSPRAWQYALHDVVRAL